MPKPSEDMFGTFELQEANVEEAKAWEAAKKRCRGLHFFAIMESEDSEQCAGFWLLREREAPRL